MKLFCAVLLIGIVAVTGCRNVMYSTYEKFGVYKRDLLTKRVTAARDEQKDAQQEFKDALTRLKEMTGFEGGKLEKEYRSLQSNYDSASARVVAVHKRIKDVETVAHDLFTEWEKENGQIQTESLRRTSREQLNETRIRYEQMIAALKDAEGSMDPVLGKLHDYVLALKHSLNAQAVASLQGESVRIQDDISKLLQEMNASIARADEFVRAMPK
ncbi:MAG: DUF2959 family protein [Limisphaerales bacterium]